MVYKIVYKESVKKDFKNIGKSESVKILNALDKFAFNFSTDYESELLRTSKIKKLKGNFLGYYRLRLRTFRVIYKKYNNELIIYIFRIGHRKDIYN